MSKFIIFSFFIVFFWSCAVSVEQAFEEEAFDSEITYEPLNLQYKGHPIFSIGQTLRILDSTMHYQKNTSGKYHLSPESITDYSCHDSNLTVWLGASYVSGNIQFSTDNDQNRIFRIIGFWTFNFKDNDSMKNEANQQFCATFFPVLKNKVVFKKGWKQTIEHPNFQEIFKSKYNNKLDLWVISYEVKLLQSDLKYGKMN